MICMHSNNYFKCNAVKAYASPIYHKCAVSAFNFEMEKMLITSMTVAVVIIVKKWQAKP